MNDDSPMEHERDLKSDLAEQWDFLQSSMLSFDAGRWHEAKRLALTIRVLVHDSNGRGLLTQMGVKDKVEWLAAGEGVNPKNFLTTLSLTSMKMVSGPDGATVSYVPLDTELMSMPSFSRRTTFDDWWTTPVIKDSKGRTFSRCDLVLMLANRDGGAHVGRLSRGEAALAAGRDFGWNITFDGETLPIELSPVFPSVRTIATEVMLVLQNNRKLLGV